MYRKYTISIRTALLACLALLAAVPASADPGDDQYTVAAAHYTHRRWQLAADEFQEFLKQHPTHARATKANFFLAESLVQARKYGDARQVFATYLRKAPAGEYARQALFRVGETSFLAGDSKQAKQALQRFANTYGNDALAAHALGYLGEIALDEQNGSEAERIYSGALERFPNAPSADEAKLGLAKALELQKKHDKAVAAYKALVEHDSDVAPRALHNLGTLHLSAQEFDAAADVWSNFETRYPQSDLLPKARLGLGRALLELGKYERAQKLFAKLLKDESLGVEAAYWHGLTYKARGEWRAAAEALQRAAHAHSGHELAGTMIYHAADALAQTGDYKSAAGAIESFAAKPQDSAYVPLQYLLGVAYQQQDQHERAIEVLQRIALSSEGELKTNVYAALGHSLYSLESYAKAVEPLRAYLKAQSDGPAAQRSCAQLAISLAREARWKEAQIALTELKTRHTASDPTMQTIRAAAEIAQAAGNHDFAREWFATLAEQKPSAELATTALAGLAQSHERSNDLDQSEQTLARLIEEHPNSPRAIDAALRRAQMLEKLQRPDGALAMYLFVIDRKTGGDAKHAALIGAGRVLAGMKQHSEAAEHYERAVTQFADHDELDIALYGWAWALRDSGSTADSDAAFERICEQYPESQLWADSAYRLAESAVLRKEYESALERLEVLVSKPAQGELLHSAIYLRGQIHLAKEDWSAARADFERLMSSKAPGSLRTSAAYWNAEATYRAKDYAEAETLFGNLNRTQLNESVVPVAALRHAQSLAQQNKWNEAYATVKDILTEYPDFEQQYEVDYLLGRCLASHGEFEDARAAYLRVTASPMGGKTETAAMAQWMIGESYFHQKRYDDAIREYLRLEILYAYPRWQAGALLQAGKCHELLGQRIAASELYLRLITNYPNTEFTEEASKRHRVALQATPNRR